MGRDSRTVVGSCWPMLAAFGLRRNQDPFVGRVGRCVRRGAVGRFVLSGKLGMRGSARPRWTSRDGLRRSAFRGASWPAAAACVPQEPHRGGLGESRYPPRRHIAQTLRCPHDGWASARRRATSRTRSRAGRSLTQSLDQLGDLGFQLSLTGRPPRRLGDGPRRPRSTARTQADSPFDDRTPQVKPASHGSCQEL